MLAITAKARRGEHVVAVDAMTLDVVSQTYKPYPRFDPVHDPKRPKPKNEVSVPALVFPVYEEYRGQIMERQRVML